MIPYGHNWQLKGYPGAVNVEIPVLSQFVVQVGLSLIASGFRTLIIWNGHGGNIGALTHACERLADAGATAAAVTWWLDFAREIKRHVPSQGHAGADELAVLAYVEPEVVRPAPAGSHPYVPRGVVCGPGLAEKLFPEAYTGTPSEGTAAAGKLILEDVCMAAWERFVAVRDGHWLATM